jgi:regulator of RNase E activity RraA
MESINERYERLYSGVIYDSLIFDIGFKGNFVVDYQIKDNTHCGVYFGKAFTCAGSKVLNPSMIDDTIRIKMFNDFFPNCIQVIDTGSDMSVAHFGDISGKLAKKFGAKCAVIDGLTRDASILSKDKYSVFCRGVTPIDAYERWQITDFQCNISLPAMNGGVINVTPDDYLFCDSDGVMVIKQELVTDVLRLAEDRNSKENKVREEIKSTNDIQGLYNRIGRW